jgi:hypothetical protein
MVLDFVRQASEAGPERLTLIRDLLREVFGKATQAPSPSSQPQVITAERPVVKEVQVPRPAPVVPKELADRLTALEERMSKFEASLERLVEAIEGQDRALMDEVSGPKTLTGSLGEPTRGSSSTSNGPPPTRLT